MVNLALAEAGDRLIYFAIGVYTLALLAMAAEWAFGSRSRFAAADAISAPAKALIGAGAPATPVASAPPVAVTTGGPDATRSRGERFGRVGLSLATLAFALHFAGLAARGLAAERAPWGNMYEFSATSALAAMGIFLVLTRRYDIRWLGVFVVGPVLLTLGLAVTVLYAEAAQLQPALQSYWLVVHVIAMAVSGGAFTVGGVLSVLYLVQHRAERRGVAGVPRVPAAAALDRLAYRVHAFVFPLWTFGVIAGAIWAENAWGRYWGWDPKETWSFITWVVYAAYLHARATAGWRGRGAAAIALVGFGTFLFNYFFINMVVTGLHSYAGT